MFSENRLMQLWFIGLNCYIVHGSTNTNELITAVNVEFQFDHNVHVVENTEIGDDIKLNDDMQYVAKTIFTASNLSKYSLQGVFGQRVLLVLSFRHFDYFKTETILSKLYGVLNSDIKFILSFGW